MSRWPLCKNPSGACFCNGCGAKLGDPAPAGIHQRFASPEPEIAGGEPSDQVGCVRRFRLRDGNRIREQLLALSDRDHICTYCILDASVPLRRYVATLQLKRVTDGERTFWHWQSTFDAPRGPRARAGQDGRHRRL